MHVIGIDPGLRGCGIASVIDNTLEGAWYAGPLSDARNRELKDTAERAFVTASRAYARLRPYLVEDTHVVIERPEIYANRPVPTEDMMQCMAVVGALVALIRSGSVAPRCVWVLPKTWKKQAPKEIKLIRIEQALTTEEISRIHENRSTYRHNAIDAIGIAKWYTENVNYL